MQNSTNTNPIPPGHVLEKIADRAATTVPTVRNYLRGGTSKPRIAARIDAALAELGILVERRQP
jgi:hypothetical protein